MSKAMKWQCPHCNHFVTITQNMQSYDVHYLEIDNAIGKIAVYSTFFVCPNPDCNFPTCRVWLSEWHYAPGGGYKTTGKKLKEWRLYPEGSSRPYPDYVPQVIRNDYQEACLIVNQSPKASATLSRRCLQGILRDYWKVKPGRLVDEIKEITDKVDPVTWNAIDSVRSIGNIGAHMEKDINVIVDVDPGEAELLIQLVETLLTEWYVGRHEREQRMLAVSAAAAAKKEPPQSAPA